MSQHIALFHFAPRSLLVQGEVLGSCYYIERDGAGVLVTFPAEEGDFGPVGEGDSWGEGLIRRFSFNQQTGEIFGAVAKIVQVAVVVESIASSEDDTDEGRQDGSRALTRGLNVGVSVIEDFVAWIRTEGEQPWIGPSHEQVPLNRFDLIDAERGGSVRNVSIPQAMTLMANRDDEAATLEQIRSAIGHVASDDQIQVAEVLLADARDAMYPPSVSVAWQKDRRDSARGLLLAAIASEVKIKRTLIEKAPSDRRDLVELIVSNPREVTVAAAQLVHKPMKAAVGRSLHEDDPDLFGAVDTLFRRRNRLAHDAKRPTTTEASDAVATAVALFAWLDSL